MNKKMNENTSDELQNLIHQGQTKVSEIRTEVKARGIGLDLTCKMQLRDDCKNVEKYIKKIQAGGSVEKNTEQLRLAILRLEMSSNGILFNDK